MRLARSASASLQVAHRVERLELDVRVAELDQDVARADLGAREHGDPVDAPGGHRRDDALLLGNQSSVGMDLPQHGTALDGVDEQRGALDLGRGRPELRQAEGGEEQGERSTPTSSGVRRRLALGRGMSTAIPSGRVVE